MINPVNDSSPNQDPSSPQTPRSDLQTTKEQQTTAAPTQSSAVTQDQLSSDTLRVGSTGTVVKNSTSTPSNLILGHDYINAAWLWLVVPIVLAILLFRPQKKSKPVVVAPVSTPLAAKPTQVVTDEPKVEQTEASATAGTQTESAAVATPQKAAQKKSKKKKK